MASMNTMLEYVVYRTTGLEYIFQLLLLKMSVEANVRRFLRHSLVCATRLWGTLGVVRVRVRLQTVKSKRVHWNEKSKATRKRSGLAENAVTVVYISHETDRQFQSKTQKPHSSKITSNTAHRSPLHTTRSI
jgi:hypothetical protein